jgi:hypothetical protein
MDVTIHVMVFSAYLFIYLFIYTLLDAHYFSLYSDEFWNDC